MNPRRPNQTADWLLISRPIGVSAILGTGMFILRGEPSRVVPLAIIISISWGLSLAYWFGLRRIPFRPFMWTQLTLDVLLVSAIVALSGGAESQFSLLYFMPVICGAMFLFAPGSFTMAAASSVCYSLLLVAEQKGLFAWLPPAVEADYAKGSIFLRGYMHVLFFFLVAAMGTYLSERLRTRVRELEQVRITTDDILENMGSGVITVDRTGRVVYFNRAARAILDCQALRTRGRMLEEVVPREASELTRLILRGLKDRTSEHRREIELGPEEEPAKILGVSGKVLEDNDGNCTGYLVLFSDLTQVKETQERLRRSERMAAVGELSADMAHEIRNPLASIRGSVETLAAESDYQGDNRRLMDLVVKETDRLNTIIEHFLTFARARPPSFEKVSLAKVVEDVADLVKTNPDFRKSIQLKTMIPAGDTSVRADPEQTKQVLLNLCLNSLNAMEDGGQLTIEVLEKANVLGVAVKDTGVGISRDQISRIFQPFYTTREKGIGLGLSIAHRIVEQHGGWIDVESAIGKGSRFTVWFPKFTSEKKGSDSYGW